MEKQTDFLEYRGHIYDVFSHRVERTVLGTVWRFIMDNRRTFVLVPVQTPNNAPANPGLVPRYVKSALLDLAGLAQKVSFAYGPQKGTKAYDDDNIRSAGWLERWYKYADDKFAKKDGAAEKSAFELIQAANSRWRGKRLPVANLKELRDLLFDAVRQARGHHGHITQLKLKDVRDRWKEITGQDLTESILLACDKRMPGHVDELAKQTAEVEGMTEDQARQFIMKRVSHVAELGEAPQNRGQYEVLVLLQSATFSVHNKEDEEEFRRVAPTEAEREEIKAAKEKLQLKKSSGHMAGFSDDQDEPITRQQAAAFIHKSRSTLTNLMHDKVIRYHKIDRNVWFFKHEISEDLKKHGWQKPSPPTKK